MLQRLQTKWPFGNSWESPESRAHLKGLTSSRNAGEKRIRPGQTSAHRSSGQDQSLTTAGSAAPTELSACAELPSPMPSAIVSTAPDLWIVWRIGRRDFTGNPIPGQKRRSWTAISPRSVATVGRGISLHLIFRSGNARTPNSFESPTGCQ
jgi:hypothetical protein